MDLQNMVRSGPPPDIRLPAHLLEELRSAAIDRLINQISDPWVVSAETARVLARAILSERATRIIEFGAGMSSRIIAAALEELGGGMLTSLEENPRWCTESWSAVSATYGLDAELIPGRVRLTLGSSGPYYGYRDLERLAARAPFDFAFIDAPYGPLGRDGALHACYEALVPGALIMLDDAARPREQGVIRRWLATYRDLRLDANDATIGRGIAILRKTGGKGGRGRLDGFVWRSAAVDMMREAPRIWRYRRNAGKWV